MLHVFLGIRMKLWYFISSDHLRYPECSELGSQLLASVQWLAFSKCSVYIMHSRSRDTDVKYRLWIQPGKERVPGFDPCIGKVLWRRA